MPGYITPIDTSSIPAGATITTQTAQALNSASDTDSAVQAIMKGIMDLESRILGQSVLIEAIMDRLRY